MSRVFSAESLTEIQDLFNQNAKLFSRCIEVNLVMPQ